MGHRGQEANMAGLTINNLYAIKRGGAAPTARPRPKPEKEASMPKSLPSPELLRKLLRYEPDTGKLFWRERTPDMFVSECRDAQNSCSAWNSKFSNKEAFTSICRGYKSGAIFGKNYRAHRVIWAIFYGKWPKGQIDHINGLRSDNRIENLRDVTNEENHKNMKIRSDNSSGVMGVFFYKSRKKWEAYIKADGRKKHLGYFASIDEAIDARRDAEKEYGYHENHGRD